MLRLDYNLIPADEHSAARLIELNMLQLESAADQFRSAADLYIFAHNRKIAGEDDPRRMIGWIGTAGRSGAIITQGFHEVMQAINAARAPKLQSLVDVEARRRGSKLFAAEFPDIAAIRVSAAHPGELTSTDLDADRNRLKYASTFGTSQFAAGTLIEGMMNAVGDRLIYGSTVKGKLVHYELSFKKADSLNEVIGLYHAAFKALAYY